jgi:hypothetical protein
MPITGGAAGTTRGQRISIVWARINETKSFKYGYKETELLPAPLGDGQSYNGDIMLSPLGSTTEPRAVEGGPVNSTGAEFIIAQDKPEPFKICALFFEISIAEEI